MHKDHHKEMSCEHKAKPAKGMHKEEQHKEKKHHTKMAVKRKMVSATHKKAKAK
jgi:hypothetical protein